MAGTTVSGREGQCPSPKSRDAPCPLPVRRSRDFLCLRTVLINSGDFWGRKIMLEMKGIDQLSIIVAFVVPGLIALYCRAQFLTGRLPPANEAVLASLALSLTYYGILIPFVGTGLAATDLRSTTVSWFVFIVAGPAIFGSFLGFWVQKRPLRRWLDLIGINLVHPTPTAWDWWFKQPHWRWIIITLKDGTTFKGYYGPDSFASSDPAERDVFVEKIYEVDENGQWIETGDKGLFIAHGEIRTLEFLPILPPEAHDVGQKVAVLETACPRRIPAVADVS